MSVPNNPRGRRRLWLTGSARALGLSSRLLLAGGFAAAGCAQHGRYVLVDDVPQRQASPSAYRIQPYDELSVSVWNQENLSTTVHVRSDLKITLPLLGDLSVGGLTPAGAARLIERRLRGLVLEPKVAVVVNSVRRPTYSVLGEVANPGSFELTPGQGVLNAVAAAGGLTDYSDREALFVIRRSAGVTRIRFCYKDLVEGIGKGPLFHLRNGDVVVVE